MCANDKCKIDTNYRLNPIKSFINPNQSNYSSSITRYTGAKVPESFMCKYSPPEA